MSADRDPSVPAEQEARREPRREPRLGRRLVLLRHGRTSWNAEYRAQGHADVALDEAGHAQAAAVAPYLASLEPVRLWTSDLVRARETCAYLERETGLVAREDPRLREYDVGARQGLTTSEFAERFPEEHAAWRSGVDMVRLPGAEVAEDVERRIRPALEECLESLSAGQTGVVVTHGAALKVGLVALLRWPSAMSTTLGGIDNCAWVTVEEPALGEPLRLLGYNESVRAGHDAPTVLPDDQ